MNSSYLNSAAGAFLGVVFVLMTVSILSEGIFHSEKPEQEGFAIVAAESADEGDAGGAAAVEAVPVATLLASADPAKGEAVFKKCAACHTAEDGGANKVGPNLYGIVNRPVASHAGFAYSAGMKTYAEGGKLWDFEALNHFLLAPKKHVAGTSMGFAGLKKDDERANAIAYLNTLAASPAPLPAQ